MKISYKGMKSPFEVFFGRTPNKPFSPDMEEVEDVQLVLQCEEGEVQSCFSLMLLQATTAYCLAVICEGSFTWRLTKRNTSVFNSQMLTE